MPCSVLFSWGQLRSGQKCDQTNGLMACDNRSFSVDDHKIRLDKLGLDQLAIGKVIVLHAKRGRLPRSFDSSYQVTPHQAFFGDL